MTAVGMTRESDPGREVAWLADGADETGAFLGYDRPGGPESIWVLHSMWELPTDEPVPTHDEVHRRELEAGTRAPAILHGTNLEVGTVTGGSVGYEPAPGAGWVRLRWAELARRIALRLGADKKVPPGFRWFPIESWPANILPPAEGSLDEVSLRALLRVLAEHSARREDTVCRAFYASLLTSDFDRPTVFGGPLRAVPTLVQGPNAQLASPSNLWPQDRSWLVYTNWDLWATKVSGSRQLIADLVACPDLETLVWSAPV